MHCRPCYGTNIPICSPLFLFFRPGYATTSNYQTYTPPSYDYHDQAVSPSQPPIPPRRRRRLEDPITTYASNYYATVPRQLSQVSSSPPSSSQSPPPLPPPRRIRQHSDRNGGYCDLFNLLERPSPPSPPIIKQRRKYNINDSTSPRRYHRPTDSENVHTKFKKSNDRKCHHQHSCYYKEKKTSRW